MLDSLNDCNLKKKNYLLSSSTAENTIQITILNGACSETVGQLLDAFSRKVGLPSDNSITDSSSCLGEATPDTDR